MAKAPTDTLLKSASVNAPHPFKLTPDADARASLAADVGIRGIKKLAFEGELRPEGTGDLVLEAMLATVVQDCVVTTDPVTTRIDTPVLRRYLADMAVPEGDEVEMPEDDTLEPLPDSIDIAQIMAEALALELPAWPRAEGVEPVDLSVTEPGKTPMTDEDTKPFAALKSLRKIDEDTGENDG